MANVKISGMSPAAALTGNELMEIVQAGANVRTTAAAVGNAANAVNMDAFAHQSHGTFLSSLAQTLAVNTPQAVRFPTTSTGFEVTIANDTFGNATRLTYSRSGLYTVRAYLRITNTDAADKLLYTWLRLNGTDVPNTTNTFVVPKAADGGINFAILPFTFSIANAGDYLEVMMATDDVDVSLQPLAAIASPYARPASPSAVIQTVKAGPKT